MSGNLRLYGATSGYSQISAPDVAGDQIFVVPSLGGEVIVSGNNQSLDLGTGDLTAAGGTFSGDLTADDIIANSLTLPTAPVVGYQEGTIANTLVYGTATGVFDWSRIGNRITIQGSLSSFTDRTTAGNVTITSLPYLPKHSVAGGAIMARYVPIHYTSTYVSAASDAILVYSVLNNNYEVLTHNELSAPSASVYFVATYLTDDTTWTPINGATVS